MSQYLAIITARGGSKSIPRKNIKMLAGKPLIVWTIQAARSSTLLDRVIVSTDDSEIAAISSAAGAEVPFLRPAKLALDETPSLPVLQHAVRWLEANENFHPDLVVTLQPTSPLRRAEHIDEAIALELETNADAVVSVSRAPSPFWMKRLEGNRVFPFMPDAPEYTRRQDLPPVYRVNGAVYVTRYKVLMEQNRIQGHDTRAIVMDDESSIDVDTLLDFKFAELVLKQRGGEL